MNIDRERQIAEEFKQAMLEAIQQFFDRHLEPVTTTDPAVPDRRVQLAAAVLLLEMTRADLEIKPGERDAAVDAVKQELGLTEEETREIVRLAEKQVERSVPLHLFAQLIDEKFSLEQKKQLVEQMWRIAFSDAELLAHEEYLVRKVSGLLHLPLADFLDAKIRARDRFE